MARPRKLGLAIDAMVPGSTVEHNTDHIQSDRDGLLVCLRMMTMPGEGLADVWIRQGSSPELVVRFLKRVTALVERAGYRLLNEEAAWYADLRDSEDGGDVLVERFLPGNPDFTLPENLDDG